MSGNWLKSLGRGRSHRRPRSRHGYQPRLEALEDRVVPSADVLTYHNNLARDGANLNETTLTPTNVNSTNFGKLFSYSVDGQVYAEPLYKAGVSIPGQGTHNVVYVATEHDSVYAFDADSNTAGPQGNGLLWRNSFLSPGVTPFSQADAYGCSQISPEIGITATPVIDAASNTIYVVAQTKEVVGSTTTYHQKLHALDLATGAERFGGPVEITASVPGTGDGGTTVTFYAQDYKERCGLVLLNGVIYTSFASHCDVNPSGRHAHGWVIGYNATTLAQTSVFCTSPNGNLDTIWQGGGSLAADSSGNLYFETGNGSAGPSNSNYSEAFLKLSTTGGVLSVADYFIPANYASLDSADQDLGSGAPIVLPDQPGTHTHLLVGAGKDGRIFLIDRDNMGHLNNPPSGPDLIVQELAGGTISGGSWDTPAYFDSGSDGNRWIYYAGNGDRLKAFSLTNGRLSTTATSQSITSFGYPGATPIVSANGTSNGIVWAVQQSSSTAVLRAYDATNLATELYNSNQAGTRDRLGASVKFATPTIADGKVFVGTSNSVTVFGLLGPILSPIPNQTILSSQQTLNVPLTVTNPGGTLTFSATGQSLAYVATQQTGALTYHSEWDNWGGRGEKWLLNPSNQWYYVLPSGELDRWDGSSITNGPALGNVGASFYADPTLLASPPANQPHATFSFSGVTTTGATLTVTRDTAWTSGMAVTVTVSNGRGSDTKSFNVTVATPPVLPPVADRTIPSSQQTLTVPLTVTNPSGHALTFSATGQSLAYVDSTVAGTPTHYAYRSVWDNWGGRGEKWVQAANGQWYFILANGQFYQWDGSSQASGTLLGNVGASYYTDPTRLTDPPANQPHATFSFSEVTTTGATLTITRDTAWISGLAVIVTVTDGVTSQTDNKIFDVFVTP